MRTLLLERNPFCCDVDLIEMARLLEKAKERPVLRELSIRQCNISDLGCEKLANAIIESRNRTLCMINLESNCITSAGVVSISKALLHKECCIKSIRLGWKRSCEARRARNCKGNFIEQFLVLSWNRKYKHGMPWCCCCLQGTGR